VAEKGHEDIRKGRMMSFIGMGGEAEVFDFPYIIGPLIGKVAAIIKGFVEEKEGGIDLFCRLREMPPMEFKNIIEMTDFVSVRPDGQDETERDIPDEQEDKAEN
jgi:hypothetical protein